MNISFNCTWLTCICTAYNIVKSERVEAAMRAVDRGQYSSDPKLAYEDTPHSIGYGKSQGLKHINNSFIRSNHFRTTYARHVLGSFERLHRAWVNFFLFPLLFKPPSRAKVLDVGSGSGYLSACFASMVGESGKVIGIDRIPQLVAWSRENVNRDNPQFFEKGK